MLKRTIAVALIAASMAGAAHAQTLRFGLMEDPDALDPTLARTFTSRMVFAAMCDKLVDIDSKLDIVPQLATEWAWSSDEKSLTLKIRPGVQFHDGEPLNAEAVKFNIERHISLPGSQRKGELSAVDNVEVVDDLTVKVNLKTPFAPLLATFTDRSGMMISPKAAKALGDKFPTAPVCAGPFKFVERIAQDRIVVEKFDKYWNKDSVFLKRIEFRSIPDTTVRLTNLRSGQLDLLERLAPTDLAQVQQEKGLKVGSTYELGFQTLIINTAKDTPISKDPKIREALELSIDREALNQVVFNGEFLAGNQWVNPRNPYYVASFPIPKRDVAKAKALLKEAGVTAPIINVMVFADNLSQQVAQVIQAMAKEAGFDIRIQATDFGTALNLADQGDYDVFMYNWSGRPDPDGNTYNFLGCKAPINYSRYCSPKANAALDASRLTTNLDQRKAAWSDLAEEVLADRPFIYLFHRKLMWAYTAKLSGFGEYPDGLVRFTGLKLD